MNQIEMDYYKVVPLPFQITLKDLISIDLCFQSRNDILFLFEFISDGNHVNDLVVCNQHCLKFNTKQLFTPTSVLHGDGWIRITNDDLYDILFQIGKPISASFNGITFINTLCTIRMYHYSMLYKN